MKNKFYKNRSLYYSILCILALSFLSQSCNKDDDDETLVGNWVKVSDFEGVPRADAVAFTIGNKAYLGTGYDGDDRRKDFWEYDPVLDFWQQKTDFPGVGRNGAVGFGADTAGYIGTGYDGQEKLKDFWRYSPASNTWTHMADFGGSARYGAVSFSISNIGYVGTGYDGNTLKDFWKYDPAVDSWSQIVSIGGSKRRDAAAFVIDGIAYVVTGVNNGTYVTDFWAYDPAAGYWTEKRAIDNISDEEYDDSYDFSGIYGTAFTVNQKGYLATAGKSTISTSVWEYNSLEDLWEEKTEFEGSARMEAVAFTINNRGYVASGRSSSYYFDDIWEFLPDEEYEEYD